MSKMNALLNLITPDIERIDKTMRADVENLGSATDDLLLEILEYGLFGGGKRFRPLLAVMAARLCNDVGEGVYNIAIAFEYLHMATLFHDDVIDKAETRRGKPSVCKTYGTTPAILAGDFLHARSMAIIGKHGGSEAMQIFCSATSGMVDGEFLQLRNAKNFNQSEQDYFAAIHGKTALLIAATTEIGGLYGGADKKQQQFLREYGSNLGYGFQIVDDLLDYQGDQRKMGKTVGNDLFEGKMTLPLVLTLEKADSTDRRTLLDILADVETRLQSFAVVSDLIMKYDGFNKTKKRAEHCINLAIRQLDNFSQAKKREKEILTALAQYALVREK